VIKELLTSTSLPKETCMPEKTPPAQAHTKRLVTDLILFATLLVQKIIAGIEDQLFEKKL